MVANSIFYISLGLLIGNLLSSCSSGKETKNATVDNIEELYVCEVVSNTARFDGKVITIRGSIEGFHQLVIFGRDCREGENLILTDLNYADFPDDLDRPTKVTRRSSDIRGEVIVTGRFLKDAGEIRNLGERVENLHTGEVIREPANLKGQLLKEARLISFARE